MQRPATDRHHLAGDQPELLDAWRAHLQLDAQTRQSDRQHQAQLAIYQALTDKWIQADNYRLTQLYNCLVANTVILGGWVTLYVAASPSTTRTVVLSRSH